MSVRDPLIESESSNSVADPATGGPGGPPPIDQNLGLVMAARLRHGANFHLNP